MRTAPFLRTERKRGGFTLVELSIVLVILGLLVGGVLAGQSLIRAAQIRAVTVEFDEFKTAMGGFREKYFALPGDMPNATKFWGADSGCPTTGYDGVPKKETCDGDGDGRIAATSDWGKYFELYRAWQQLADAGLIQGQYVGNSGPGAGFGYQDSIIGKNVPRSRVAEAGWSFYPLERSYILDPTFAFNNNYKTSLLLSAPFTASGIITAILSGPESWKIDTKIDDGRPGYGIVSSWKNTGPGLTCLTTDTQTASEYQLSDDTLRCSLIFKLD